MRLLASLLLLHGVISLQLNIDPSTKVINDRENVTVMCRATVPLDDCQFTWWDLDYDDKPVYQFDFHLGNDSDAAYLINGSEINWRLAGYRYVGKGLDAGECGIQLFGLVVRYRKLSCRARERGMGWTYAYMTIKGNVSTQLRVSPSEQAPVVLPYKPFTISSMAVDPLKSCSFRFNDMAPILFTLPNRTTTWGNNTCKNRQGCRSQQQHGVKGNDFWTSRGHPIQGRQCKITVKNVTEMLNGLVYFEALTEAGQQDRNVFHLTVAKAPADVVLRLEPENAVPENAYFTATCSVGVSRPAANITWYVGEQVFREDALDDSSPSNHNDSPWRWMHEMNTLTQTITLQATSDLKGQRIRCEVRHVALDIPARVVKTINITGTETRHKVVCLPELPGHGVVQHCWSGSGRVDCSKPVQIGTVVTQTLQCPGNSFNSRGNRTCLATGEWDEPSLRCLPKCGTTTADIRAITPQGKPVVQGQFPWNVIIYQLKDDKHEQVCIGSLISMNTVLTAASCFVSNMWGERHFNRSLYMVAAAKLHRGWEVHEPKAQIRSVISLSVSPYFGGETSFFNYNLAFLKVTAPFEYTEEVSPLCLDRNLDPTHQRRFIQGKDGFLPGFGVLEEEVGSASTLNAVRLRFVNHEQCEELLEPAAQRLVTSDTFCAGSTEDLLGYTACDSDYGGGLVFLHEASNQFYLRGVANLAFKPRTNNESCYPSRLFNFATFFTLDFWLKEVLD